jgi:integrase
MGYHNRATGHGFRASASTLLNEELKIDADVVERQLAHQERNQVRAAYHRARYLGEREEMMQRWADFLDEIKFKASLKAHPSSQPNLLLFPRAS